MKSKKTQIMPTVWIVIFTTLFLIIAGRFLYIQVSGEVSGVSIQQLADQKRTNNYNIPASRGTIYDRNGMALAQEHIVYRLYAIVDESHTTNPLYPKHVKDVEETAQKLAPILEMDESDIAERLNDGISNERFQVEFGSNARELNQEQKEEIEALELSGINFIEEPIRFYPNGMFASHTIGLTDKQDDKIFGINGVEGFMNDYLIGEDGSISYQRDKFNMKLLDPKEVINKPDNGDDVYLTLDQKVQTLVEDALSEVEEEYDPDRMTAVVMNAKTGEILSLSNRPSYNPNSIGEVQNWYNDVIATPFEPGSTMKIFTLASAIEEGVWNPDDEFQSGTYKVGNITIGDHNGRRGWGEISYLEGIQRSSNVGIAKLAYEKIGPDRFLEYLQDFDFDKKTDIDLPGEVAGRILYNWESEKVTTAFGQGTTTTPIQLMKAATAIANDGKMLKPYIIEKTLDHETKEVIAEHEPEVVGEPISSETAKKTLEVLETVITSENGTGHNIYNLNDYTVAGKTGTAQIPDSENKGYKTGKENYVFSFLGMAPADDPKLIMYVSVKEPNLDQTESGSAPVSFVFKNVMENSLRYLNIEPDKEATEPIEVVEIPVWEDKQTDSYVNKLKDLGIEPIVIGDGEHVKKVNLESGTKITTRQTVLVATDNMKMPDLKGWSFRDVLSFRDFLDLDLEWMGSGYVKKQSIEKGSSLNEKDYLMVELEEPDVPEDQENASDESGDDEIEEEE
ncbi:penicillin-binding protein [Gracilibacillus salitolerans]|uniref:serine-type D-Ala-D-Ala carboxypeptidase n=1 Tax=Gracilibacillus salitolerans TaxID=2663022 RepID=A0A5Q2TJV8_9BACI|nr:penicillin-binding transpeptidase domain-containing protein [Gracilibacillus salitolerans]QGH34421.1 penicillin-binding protein [Gracilibacillus salitolerans]